MKPQRVQLEIAHDAATGLAFNIFTWTEDNSLQVVAEAANRPMNDGSYAPMNVCSYVPEIDGPIAEARRASLETMLNSRTSRR
jgi:hypothetical protein